MKRFNQIAGKLLFSVIALFLISSCKKDEVAEPGFSRMFAPGTVKESLSQTRIELEWSGSLYSAGKAVSYEVEVSKTDDFAVVDYATTVDTSKVVITDDNVSAKQAYYVRIRAKGSGNTEASRWIVSPKTFTLPGEQIFIAPSGTQIQGKSALVAWQESAGLTHIILTAPSGNTQINLTADDLAARQKLITGLTKNVSYTVEIFAGTKSKGTLTFTTPDYTYIITQADDLIATIALAGPGETIGLSPGIYNYSAAALNIVSKHVSLQSVSGNPADTRINFKEFTLKGTGAGLRVSGIDLDGTAGAAAYFVNFTGVLADAEIANFTSVVVENSRVHGTSSALIRGNRGANNAYKIDSIKIHNSIIYDNASGGFDYILLDKMEFKKLILTRSTFYNSGRRLISWATNITVPARPTILIDQVTINGLGFGGRDYVLFDTNGNPVNATISNSIIANIPKPGQTVGLNAYRAGAGSAIQITNNNMFKITNGAATPVALNFASAPQANKTVDLGWTGTTTSFTLPAGSELRTGGVNGVVLGDPRWAN